MAKHKDLNRAHALLKDVQGWHIVNIGTGRPDRRRCKFYDKDSKICLNDFTCKGAGNCPYYQE